MALKNGMKINKKKYSNQKYFNENVFKIRTSGLFTKKMEKAPALRGFFFIFCIHK